MDTATTRTATAVEAAIIKAGETHLGMSEKSGIPRTTLLRRLAGRSPFTIAELDAISQVLGLTIADLLGEDAA